MLHIFGITLAIGLFIFVLWLLTPSKHDKHGKSEYIVFDSSDSRQIGTLIGMTGGSITDATIAQYALRRFEETYNRKATSQDIGIVIGFAHAISGTKPNFI